MDNAPIFIVGSERSGTTMLRLMLNEHSKLHFPTESHFIHNLLEIFQPTQVLRQSEIKLAFDTVTGTKRWQDWDDNPDTLWSKLETKKKIPLSDFVNIVFEHNLQRFEKSRWGDKTPKYVFLIDQLKLMFPDAKFIHIVRDGRDVCVSMLKTKWYGTSIRKIAQIWCRYTNAALEATERHPAIYTIQYENLVRNSKEELIKLCDFIDVNFEPAMLDFYINSRNNIAGKELRRHEKIQRPPSSKDLATWKKSLAFTQLLVFESYAGNQLRIFGYKLQFSGLKSFPRYLTSLLFKAADFTLPLRKKLGIHFSNFSRNY